MQCMLLAYMKHVRMLETMLWNTCLQDVMCFLFLNCYLQGILVGFDQYKSRLLMSLLLVLQSLALSDVAVVIHRE